MNPGDKDPDKRHRHDIGDVAHGPESTEETTRAIQGLLGLCIVATCALVLYALLHIGFEVAAP